MGALAVREFPFCHPNHRAAGAEHEMCAQLAERAFLLPLPEGHNLFLSHLVCSLLL